LNFSYANKKINLGARDVAQVADSLTSKHKTLSSNSSTAKKIKIKITFGLLAKINLLGYLKIMYQILCKNLCQWQLLE
jgi:hypothetical protein